MWKIKDPELKRKMNQFISDEGIDEVCRNEMSDSSTYIFFSFEDDAINFRERPLENGNYLVTRLMKTDTGVTVRFLDFGRFEFGKWAFKNDVIAFCKLPEPYFPMEKKA